MDEREIKAIVESYDARMYLDERVRTKGNGKSATYVMMVSAHGIKCMLGNLETLAHMPEDELRTRIETKLAQPSAQKGRAKHG